MDYLIRDLKESEYPLLEEFLYQAIFQRDEKNPIPRSELTKPRINSYIRDFGKYEDDFCLCAEVDRKVVGAVWVRNIQGFGSIDDQTPEFSISLYSDNRGKGIGTAMLQKLKEKGYAKASLAAQKDNYALRMYTAVGFDIVDENEEEYIMVCPLN
ncbi:GNAT family N-acetyltransferase [Enterococcus raffinosus]|uniref:GNAT family N-acetyltransferase n=1 Tax=Enterococcus raffinosus TaxID=71452 RepID=A0AAW8T9F2_9ENTE|nr:GNAT family N-acetyltransferase [Enterococcus raffinosus]MDT2521842.1 GNAT family N-acetyltransferase [Enterococcus raffinosus]MDT2529151.1 GNAT family N-acetyltransferase [Enterococcus raffinosus]MDT2532643.1 GNAT family N-acetyltransferase [Enterococcus raffinosus]MDT2544490.1 GNAT family N-acetyltransferase [Enterococcus raffinosus]MDT2556379.1 GNAT family N-acetyltransferase [Enterococcus raffinosus]